MPGRPHVLLSVAASLDGHIDDTSGTRLVLSNEEDLDRVDEVRAGVDAILVGANTIRADDPRLLVRSEARRRRRRDAGMPPDPIKVTLTGSGAVDPAARFFGTGESDKLVYTPTPAVPRVEQRLGAVATVLPSGDPLDPQVFLADLAARGVRRLMVEGGGAVHTLLLTADVVDELHLVHVPFFVGENDAPRFVHPGVFPQNPERPMTLAEVRPIGDAVLLRYLVRSGGGRDERDR